MNKPRSDHSAAHTALVAAIAVAISALPGTLVKLQNNGVAVAVRKDGSKRVIKYGTLGQADIGVTYHGISVELEVKTGTGKPSSSQIRFRAALEHAGGKYFIVRSVSDAIDALRGIAND